jgi:hypothetical protein
MGRHGAAHDVDDHRAEEQRRERRQQDAGLPGSRHRHRIMAWRRATGKPAMIAKPRPNGQNPYPRIARVLRQSHRLIPGTER